MSARCAPGTRQGLENEAANKETWPCPVEMTGWVREDRCGTALNERCVEKRKVYWKKIKEGFLPQAQGQERKALGGNEK